MAMRAAIVTVGSELTEGLRLDTNTAEIARALTPHGFRVAAAISVADDRDELAELLATLTADHELVITTGGLGPTHDDITREAASAALGLPLVRDERVAALLAPVIARHRDSQAAEQVLVQALVFESADVIDPTTGTAPGLVVPTPGGSLALLPGPPSEMRPMLTTLMRRFERVRAEPRELGTVGLTESDAQVRAQKALADRPGVSLTVLARPGDVRVLLFDEGAGEEGLRAATTAVADALGEYCYSSEGGTLQEAVVRAACTRGLTMAAAESCTGGLLGAALTDVPGSSDCFLGSVVSYSNQAKTALLGVPEAVIAEHGAVSEEVALAMAEGVRSRMDADVAVSITGIAGPGGGTSEKPVGLVWFAVATAEGSAAIERRFASSSSRDAVRQRATATALDLLRGEVLTK